MPVTPLAAATTPVNPVWAEHQSSAVSVDQQCLQSEAFWGALVPKHLGAEVAELPRFAEFLRRLRETSPTALTRQPAAQGRELLDQYTFPGIDDASRQT